MVLESNCPKCGAPLDDIPNNVEFVDCKYCSSRVRVRAASDIVREPARTYDYSSHPNPSYNYTSTTTIPEKPWHQSTVFYWVIFLILPPLWAVLAIRDQDMPQFLKVIAWFVLGGTALSCLTMLVPLLAAN